MTDGAIHAMSAAVGGLQSDVKSLKESIDNLNKVWGQREEAATSGRRTVHEKVDSLRTDFTRLSAEVENVSKDLTEIQPAINEFKNQRQQQIGARKLGGYLWSVMLVAAGLTGWGIHEIITWFRHP
jgi:chromosome segregation ATPase